MKKRPGKRLKASFIVVTASAAATAACMGSSDQQQSPGLLDGGYVSNNPPGMTSSTGTSSNPGVPTPQQPAPPPDIVLVNASPNLPPVRLCVAEHLDKAPVPNASTTKANGATSVAYSTAVNIGSIAPQATGANDTDAAAIDLADGATEAGDVSDAAISDASADTTITGYLIEETIANAFGAPDAGPGPSCAAMIQVLTQNGYEGHGLYPLHGAQIFDAGPQTIVFRGCLPDKTLTTKECGDTFNGVQANLNYYFYQPLNLFTPYDGKLTFQVGTVTPAVVASSIEVALGDGSAPMSLAFTSDMASNPVQVPLPPAYDTAMFTLDNAPVPLSVSWSKLAASSSPNQTPSQFYGQPVNFFVFVIGSPKINPTVDPIHALHFLAFPAFTPPVSDGG
jgi:hypothetical protein